MQFERRCINFLDLSKASLNKIQRQLVFVFMLKLIVPTFFFAANLLAWDHDGIPLSAYSDEPLANQLYDAPEIEQDIDKIFSAYDDDKTDPRYLDLFGTCANCPKIVFEYALFLSCTRMLERPAMSKYLTPKQINQSKRECRNHLVELNFKLVSRVKSSQVNTYTKATVSLFDFLRLHQNRLGISNLIEY